MALSVPIVSTSGAKSTVSVADPVVQSGTGKPVGGLWTNLSGSPTSAQMAAVGRYSMVILNAWDAPKMRQMKAANPGITFLVYKCFSSTRNYSGAVDNGVDAKYLPTGVGYVEANTAWFATTTTGARIEWASFPKHWQMAVWDTAYQQRWASNVTAELVREGWDGAFADNDYAALRFYSTALLAGTTSAAATDKKIRDGLDALLTTAGTALKNAGKILVPNLSEARLYPGRWTLHSRFGGAMEEHPSYVPPVQNSEYDEMINQSTGFALILSDSGDSTQTAFVRAALVSTGRTVFKFSGAGDGQTWTPEQDLVFGAPLAKAVRASNGVWWREFTKGWMGLNSTNSTQSMTVYGTSRTIAANGSLIVMKP